MHPTIRSALVLLAGVVAAVVVVVLTDALVASFYPLPAGIDPNDKEGFKQAVAVALFVLVATVANLPAIPHPVWLRPGAIILIPAAGWAAARLGGAPRVAVPPR